MKLVALFLCLWAADASAKVEAIVSGYELELSGAPSCEPQTRLAIFAQDGDEEVLGYAEVTGPGSREGVCRARVLTHSRSALVRAGDRTEVLNLYKREPMDIPGRYDLMLENKKKIAARYKPLVYGGYLFGETAATLADGEFLVGASPLFYGISNRVQVETFPLLIADRTAAGALKYKFFDGEDVTFSILGRLNHHYDVGKRSWSATLFYDSTSNSSSMSHTTLSFTSKLPTATLLEAKDKQKRFSAELTSTYEWVLTGWQRILLGPKFTAGDTKDLGFVATAVFPYRYFHWTVNVELNSITRFQFRDRKQLASFDLFWRL